MTGQAWPDGNTLHGRAGGYPTPLTELQQTALDLALITGAALVIVLAMALMGHLATARKS